MNVGWLKSFLTIEDIMNAAQGISFKIYEFHQRRIYIYEIHNEKVLMLLVLMLIPKNLKQAYNTKK